MKINKPTTVLKEESEDDTNIPYKVGYGKPPKKTQFKPGQSGNPKGRTKGHKNFNTLLRQGLSQSITVSAGGKKRSMPKYSVIITALINKALQGDMKAIQTLLPYILKMEQYEAQLAQDIQALSSNDKEILKEYVNRIRNI